MKFSVAIACIMVLGLAALGLVAAIYGHDMYAFGCFLLALGVSIPRGGK